MILHKSISKHFWYDLNTFSGIVLSNKSEISKIKLLLLRSFGRAPKIKRQNEFSRLLRVTR